MIHGTWSRYCHGCRCGKCVATGRAYAKKQREERKAAAPGYGPRVGRITVPSLTLDLVTEKVGSDFPALGTLLRTGWTEGA